MTKAADEINKKCPIMVDSITRFDNAAALANNYIIPNCLG